MFTWFSNLNYWFILLRSSPIQEANLTILTPTILTGLCSLTLPYFSLCTYCSSMLYILYIFSVCINRLCKKRDTVLFSVLSELRIVLVQGRHSIDKYWMNGWMESNRGSSGIMGYPEKNTCNIIIQITWLYPFFKLYF